MNKYEKYVKTDELRMIRAAKKLSYRDMSQKLGFKSPASYYNIESGKTMPTIEMMNNISSILGYSVEKFFNVKVQQS